MPRFSASGRARHGAPACRRPRSCPSSGRWTPARHLTRVDLPAPLSPMSAVDLPGHRLEVDAAQRTDLAELLLHRSGRERRHPGARAAAGPRLDASLDCHHTTCSFWSGSSSVASGGADGSCAWHIMSGPAPCRGPPRGARGMLEQRRQHDVAAGARAARRDARGSWQPRLRPSRLGSDATTVSGGMTSRSGSATSSKTVRSRTTPRAEHGADRRRGPPGSGWRTRPSAARRPAASSATAVSASRRVRDSSVQTRFVVQGDPRLRQRVDVTVVPLAHRPQPGVEPDAAIRR